MGRTAAVLVCLGCLTGCGRLGFDGRAAATDAPPGSADAPGQREDAPIGLDAAIACPASYVAVAGLAHAYSAVGPARSWSDASTACATDGTHLVILNDAEEATRVFAYAFPGPAVAGPSMWVGISDLATEGTWLTEQGEVPPYLPWGVGEPNDSGGEDCGELVGDLTLNDIACATAVAYVCECP